MAPQSGGEKVNQIQYTSCCRDVPFLKDLFCTILFWNEYLGVYIYRNRLMKNTKVNNNVSLNI